MTTSQNPYELTPDQIQEPPTTFLGVLSHLGPGFILSASIVGSGELIATTILGAKAGFITFWVVILSCLVKVTLQLEFGKHAIHSGETTFESFQKLPGFRLRGANWATWAWFLCMMLKFAQVGAIVGSVGLIMHEVMPISALTFNHNGIQKDVVWTIFWAAITALLIFRGYYKFIERTALILIAMFTVMTITSVVALQFTEYRFSLGDLTNFGIPSDRLTLIAVIGAFGITGVGGDEIMTYNYWLLEKGYAARTGPRDDSEAWKKRARGWIKVMYWDALLAMVCYTIVTACFYILGAAVLHRQGLVPVGDTALLDTLSKMYTDTLGPWAKNAFLLGAFFVLFSTLFAALAGWTRLYTDCFGKMGFLNFHDPVARRKWFAVLAWVIPAIWTTVYFLVRNPGGMVIVGGVATSAILLIVVVAAMHFRYRRSPAFLKPGRWYDAALWISSIVIVFGGVYAVASTFLSK